MSLLLGGGMIVGSSSRSRLHHRDDICNFFQVSLDATDNLIVYESVIVNLHPRLAKELSQRLSIESKLQENMHLDSLLTEH